jgi:hypothetical protein
MHSPLRNAVPGRCSGDEIRRAGRNRNHVATPAPLRSGVRIRVIPGVSPAIYALCAAPRWPAKAPVLFWHASANPPAAIRSIPKLFFLDCACARVAILTLSGQAGARSVPWRLP